MSHAATAAEYEAREPYQSQVHTWGDASILALLLAADYSWLVEDTEVNQLTLPLVLAWSLFITYAAFVERRANPEPRLADGLASPALHIACALRCPA